MRVRSSAGWTHSPAGRDFARFALALLAITLACLTSHAAVSILGVQDVPDQRFAEFDCYWNASAYPGPCTVPITGATVHVFLKNTGASSVTVNDATLAGYSLTTIIKKSTASWNPDELNSIYFYWDTPPQDILDAGEPVWYRFDPPTIPAGGVGQVAVRLRYLPVTQPIALTVTTSVGTVATNVPVDPAPPRLASIGYSDDLKKVYLHWRRTGGAAPASVWLDGTNVTSLTTTVGDSNVNFAASVISLSNALPTFSYHVFQGIYADGKWAAASQRAWTNKFIYATYSTFPTSGNYTESDWVAEACDHGFNNVQMNLGIMGGYLGTSSGRADCQAHGYGYTILDKSKLNPLDPDMFFLNDEPDAEEYNQANTHCGTGYKIPCDSAHYTGTLVIKTVAYGEGELRSLRPNVPFTVNLDGGEEPESYFTWGPAVDILQTDNYYEPRLADAYLNNANRIPLFNQGKVSYAVARVACAGAEPNVSNHLLYSTKQTSWPYPTPQSKRFEIYYSLAGGSKGMGYWWLNPPNGMNNTDSASLALWKEIGLAGNEIRTARPMLVKSTPVDLTLVPSAKVWAHALASGIDTFIILVVNDNYLNDAAGCHYTNVPNATVTATFPAWMQSSPTAFEITAGGLRDVGTQLNANQLQVNLGTLQLTRMITVTTDPQLRASIQQRYDQQVKSHVCNFAPELCVNIPPGITQQPANQAVFAGDTAYFTVVPSGTSPFGYQWQKGGTNLLNGGHYSGCASSTLTIVNVDTNDVASYRCVVTNAYGTATSTSATLTVGKEIFGLVTLTNIPPLSGDTANEARAITPDARWISGNSGARGFLYNSTNLISVVSFDAAQATNLTGVGYRTYGGQKQVVVSGLYGGRYAAWMTSDDGATWGAVVRGATGKKPTVPVANGLSGTSSDIFYSIWTDQGAGATDNWGLNVGQFSGAWPAAVGWGPKSASRPDTLQLNAISGTGRSVGWRRNGTTLIYANYVADWQGATTPAIWNFNGLDGTTAGQAFSVSSSGTTVFAISPKSAATGSTNYAYKAVFNTTMPGPATQLSIAQLPNFPDTSGSTSLAVPYGCTADGKYAIGMSYRGTEKAVLWDTTADPAHWTVIDLTDVAAANGALGSFTRLSRAYTVATNTAGALVIAGVGVDNNSPANARAFLMTVTPPLTPIAFPPTVAVTGSYPAGFTFSFLSPANTNINYYLEFKTNLNSLLPWTTIGSTPGTGGRTTLFDPNPSDSQRFYRVRIQ